MGKIKQAFTTGLSYPFNKYQTETIYGHKDGCSYCGKPLGTSYKFCPFRSPATLSCTRYYCQIRQYIIMRLFVMRSELAKIIKPERLEY